MRSVLSFFLLLALLASVHAGQFVSFPNQGRSNMIYIPSAATGNVKLPLVVMLHGCTQNPTDFAAGTQMNTYAEQYNFFALYPMQPQSSNQNECWNWFLPQHQSRGSGEPQIITTMVTAAAQQYTQINTSQVFVAGLSAGAAMSVILGATYPDVFNAIASCSGLEYKAADSVTTAFQAMFSGGPSPSTQGQVAYNAMGSYARPIGVYVFHGTSDTTVNYVNGQQTTAQYATTLQLILGSSSFSTSAAYTNSSQVPNGKSYTTAVYTTKSGEPMIRFTSVQGMNHAWSGGSNQGSYTDPTGPNASLFIWQFFATFLDDQPSPSSTTVAATTSTGSASVTSSSSTTGPSSSTTSSSSSSTTGGSTSSSTTGGSSTVASFNGQAGADGFVGQLTADGTGIGIDKCGDKGMFNLDTYRTILSFDVQLPSGAAIQSASLILNVTSSSGSLGGIAVDIKSGSFSGSSGLNRSAYNAAASQSGITQFTPPSVGTSAVVSIPSSAWQSIVTDGSNVTQFRLREVSTAASFTPNYVIFDDSTVQLAIAYTL